MEYPIRKEHRLKNYDYSQCGAYFITICTKERKYIFWNNYDILNVGAAFGGPYGKISLTEYGKIVKNELKKIPLIYPDVVFIPKFVIMPNHIHLIIVLNTYSENGPPKAAPTVGSIINKFKGTVSKKCGFHVWQKSFYDRVIRNEHEYSAFWKYIETNPMNWESDELFTKE
ncbi:MAG: hypothetical protein IKP25_00110 [Ruminococcus sp.]|nr:hypothetical protein [Ruminococcus sp.]